jgi:hypothetical protein
MLAPNHNAPAVLCRAVLCLTAACLPACPPACLPARLLQGLQAQGVLQEPVGQGRDPDTQQWLANPALPEDIMREAVPGNIRRAGGWAGGGLKVGWSGQARWVGGPEWAVGWGGC